MQKSRELPFDRGYENGYYYASAGSIWEPPNGPLGPFLDKMNLRKQFNEGRQSAITYKVVPSWIGTQTFSSTRRLKPLFNNCSNIRFEGVELPVTYCNEAYNRSGYYYWAPFTRIGVTGSYADAQPIRPNWGDAVSASRRAWWTMQPRFEGEFSALNFIYELKDFKDIAKHLGKLDIRGLPQHMRTLRGKLRRAQRQVASGTTKSSVVRTANAATKTWAEVHLAKVFAVDPTVRDISILHEQLLTLVNEAQDQFFRRGKKPQSTHYGECISEDSTGTTGRYNAAWKFSGQVQKVIFTATMQYRYEYQYRKWFEALKRMYGLNVNASVVWNALPFSFVVDYFLKVGQAIDSMQTDPNVELRLMQYCESLLSKTTSGTHYSPWQKAHVLINGGVGGNPDKDYLPYSGQLIGGYKGSWYERRVKTPNKGSALPRLTLPSAKQATNLVALLRAVW